MDSYSTRQIKDVQALAALTHPVRQRLLDLLKLDGPATASTLSEATGQAVGNVSHHLRVLATAELIEEAPELAKNRRERWWRLATADVRWSRGDFAGDASSEAVAHAAGALMVDRQMAFLRQWLIDRDRYDAAWHEGCAVSAETWLRLTANETRQLAEELTEVLTRWADRKVPDDGRKREPVLAFAHTVPVTP
ncbi:ArsR/SmtB family transcription factor [Solwaraspora sp. WMMA2101]|uniref:ArsR/SmtB family transcription factor n=1 Tax=Solwaraspora sp. WMMA2101 TaxID=3404124 RepID=UPI003B943AAD